VLVGAGPGLALVALVLVLVNWGPFRAWLFEEGGPAEWLQVGLAAVGLGFVVRSGIRRFSPAAVFLGILLAGLIVSEADLDRRVFGVAVIDSRFFRASTVPLAPKVLVAALGAAAGLGLLAYAARRRRALVVEMADGLARGWGGLFLAGLLLFAAPQPFETWLNKSSRLPRNVAEETLELAGCLYLAWAMAARDRQQGRPLGPRDAPPR
jgi:hypothetical protein